MNKASKFNSLCPHLAKEIEIICSQENDVALRSIKIKELMYESIMIIFSFVIRELTERFEMDKISVYKLIEDLKSIIREEKFYYEEVLTYLDK